MNINVSLSMASNCRSQNLECAPTPLKCEGPAVQIVSPYPLTDEAGNVLTDESGNQLQPQ